MLTRLNHIAPASGNPLRESPVTGAGITDRPAVIVIDDKYQSGISIQFVASVLRAAGAGEIFGFCAVKTLRDTDNA